MHVQAYNLILDGRMLLLKRNSRGKGSVKVLYEGGDQTMIRSWCRHRVERLEEEMGLHLFQSFLRTVQAEQIIKGYQNSSGSLKARTHQDEYRRALFASVFQRVSCVHTQAIFADDEPSEHANSFPDIRWRLM